LNAERPRGGKVGSTFTGVKLRVSGTQNARGRGVQRTTHHQQQIQNRERGVSTAGAVEDHGKRKRSRKEQRTNLHHHFKAPGKQRAVRN